MINQLNINKMRKLVFTLLMLLTLSLNAQVKFMGISVDGSKTEMIEKLKEKGFLYNSIQDQLTGKFNGNEVKIQIVDYNGIVGRVLVEDAYVSNETDIIIRYNNLVDQFERNGKYIGENEKINAREDIHYEMSQNHKRYEAVYYQKDEDDKEYDEFELNISYDDVDEEFVENFHNNCVSLAKSQGDDYYENLCLKQLNEIQDKSKKGIFEFDKMWLKTTMIALQLAGQSRRVVWFMIDEDENSYRKYKILLFYDSVGNRRAKGEDL